MKIVFTNLPLNKIIELSCSELFSDSSLSSGFNRREFKKLMEIATQKNMFNGKFYKQTDGVAMGSLGPILSNIFLCHQGKLWLE